MCQWQPETEAGPGEIQAMLRKSTEDKDEVDESFEDKVVSY